MVAAHKKYGKLKWADLVQPAIDLALNGFKMTARLASNINSAKAKFKQLNPNKKYLMQDADWKEGDVLVQEDLGHTLELIRDKGRDGFYKGKTADLIVAEMNAGKGIMTKTDLENYHAVWRNSIIGDFKGYKIITMPPPSSGG
jgi:gamma-glutamyltranspeptidase/glutathione hydrolase